MAACISFGVDIVDVSRLKGLEGGRLLSYLVSFCFECLGKRWLIFFGSKCMEKFRASKTLYSPVMVYSMNGSVFHRVVALS